MKNPLDKIPDIDLRWGRTNLMLESQTPEVVAAIKLIDEEAEERGKNFISHISDEEVRCGWVQSRRYICVELDQWIAQVVPGWQVATVIKPEEPPEEPQVPQ